MQTYTTNETSTSTLPAALEGREPLAFHGERVLTTELAARVFGATEGQLRENYTNNAARFEAGKHFHKVEGADLRALKDSAGFTGSVGRNARSLTLWTERGIARHAKILETETAWAIFEALEDTYFRAKGAAQSPEAGNPPEPASAGVRETREARLLHKYLLGIGKMAGLKGNQLLIAANRATTKQTGFDVLGSLGIVHLIAPTNDSLVTPTKLGEDLGLGRHAGNRVNKRLAAIGLCESDRDEKGRLFWKVTEKGEAAGGRMVDVERSNGTGAAQQLKWPTSVLETLKASLESPVA